MFGAWLQQQQQQPDLEINNFLNKKMAKIP
jgi:hypothetical protein